MRSFVMDHFCGLSLRLIALLKLFAAAATAAIFVFNVDKGTYIVING
jgi:hypothetical protein